MSRIEPGSLSRTVEYFEARLGNRFSNCTVERPLLKPRDRMSDGVSQTRLLILLSVLEIEGDHRPFPTSITISFTSQSFLTNLNHLSRPIRLTRPRSYRPQIQLHPPNHRLCKSSDGHPRSSLSLVERTGYHLDLPWLLLVKLSLGMAVRGEVLKDAGPRPTLQENRVSGRSSHQMIILMPTFRQQARCRPCCLVSRQWVISA